MNKNYLKNLINGIFNRCQKQTRSLSKSVDQKYEQNRRNVISYLISEQQHMLLFQSPLDFTIRRSNFVNKSSEAQKLILTASLQAIDSYMCIYWKLHISIFFRQMWQTDFFSIVQNGASQANPKLQVNRGSICFQTL